MKLTNQELLLAYKGLHAVLEKNMPCKLGYAVQKNLRAVEAALIPYDQERVRQLRQYAQTDETGNLITDESGQALFEGSNESLFRDTLAELQAIEAEVDVRTVSLDLFEGVDLTGLEMLQLDFMIE